MLICVTSASICDRLDLSSLICSSVMRLDSNHTDAADSESGLCCSPRAGAGERAPGPARVLAFVPGVAACAEVLATELIERVPTSVVLVLAFDQETCFGNDWVTSMWPHVRVLSWKDEAGVGTYEEELLERTRVYLPAGADLVLDLSAALLTPTPTPPASPPASPSHSHSPSPVPLGDADEPPSAPAPLPAPHTVFATAADAARLERRLPRLERRFRALLKPVRSHSLVDFNSKRSVDRLIGNAFSSGSLLLIQILIYIRAHFSLSPVIPIICLHYKADAVTVVAI